jgi:hypothetical protein
MARGNNLPAKIYKAGERTETTLKFQWNAGDGNSTNTVYIDLAQALSQINRRAYRQGLYYYVASVTFSNGTEAYCQVNTLPDTWMTKRAWTRGYKKWSEMNRRAADGQMPYPKYHDFKVAMINGAVGMNVQYGKLESSNNYTSDDWVISQFVTEDPYLHGGSASDTPVEAHNADQFTSHMLGGHVGSSGAWTSIGLIRSLGDVWALQPAEGEPSTDADMDTDPLANLFDSSDTHDDVRLNMDEDNDEPPYDHNVFPGASSIEETVVGAVMRVGTGGAALTRAPGFCAPLGLLEVNVSDFSAGTTIDVVEMIIELVPGTYNGVYAERIL